MGFIMEEQGNISIETRRESFIIVHSAEWQREGYDSIEIGFEDLPDLIMAITKMTEMEHLVTGFSIDEYKKVGKRLERQKEIEAEQLRGEYESV